MATFAEQQPAELALTNQELVSLWRFDQFHQLGFDEEDACLLSESDVDLNRARSLISAGCRHSLALKILI